MHNIPEGNVREFPREGTGLPIEWGANDRMTHVLTGMRGHNVDRRITKE